MNFNVVLHKDKTGYWAEVPTLKGCFSQGETLQEVEQNIKEAISAWVGAELPLVKEEIIVVSL